MPARASGLAAFQPEVILLSRCPANYQEKESEDIVSGASRIQSGRISSTSTVTVPDSSVLGLRLQVPSTSANAGNQSSNFSLKNR